MLWSVPLQSSTLPRLPSPRSWRSSRTMTPRPCAGDAGAVRRDRRVGGARKGHAVHWSRVVRCAARPADQEPLRARGPHAAEIEPGHERGDCWPDWTCDVGLLYLSNLCVRPPTARGGLSGRRQAARVDRARATTPSPSPGRRSSPATGRRVRPRGCPGTSSSASTGPAIAGALPSARR